MQIGVRNVTPTVRATTYCIHAFGSAVCKQHGIKKLLWVTMPLNVLDVVQSPCLTDVHNIGGGGWRSRGIHPWSVCAKPKPAGDKRSGQKGWPCRGTG